MKKITISFDLLPRIVLWTMILFFIGVIVCGVANAQECTILKILKPYEIMPFKKDSIIIVHRYSGAIDYMPIIEYNDDETLIIYQDFTITNSLSLREAYEAECNKDTIKATMAFGQYLIDRGTYKEVLTERQLEDKGYKYKYRWVFMTDSVMSNPLEYEYVFLKEPTFKGFTKYLRKLSGRERQ